MIHRRRVRGYGASILGFTGAIAAVLGGCAATAYACSAVMGNLVMSSNSGAAGTQISTSASGLKGNAVYALHFGKTTSSDCMAFTGVITLARIKSGATGAWNNVTAVIPSTASMGGHGLCGIEVSPVKGQTGTTHGVYTVT